MSKDNNVTWTKWFFSLWTKLKNLYSEKQVVNSSWSITHRYSCNSQLLNGLEVSNQTSYTQASWLRDWFNEVSYNTMLLREQYNLNKITFRNEQKTIQQTTGKHINRGKIKSSRWIKVH